MKKGSEDWEDCHPRQVVDNVGKPFFMEKVQDASSCFSNGSLHCCIDWRNAGGAKTGVDKMNGIVDTKKVTQLNQSGVGEPLVPFYHQGGHWVLE